MSYLEHFNDQARADLHMIAHTQKGCRCNGDGVQVAPTAQEEPAANESPPIITIEEQRMDAADQGSSIVLRPPSSCKPFYLHEIHLISGSKYFRTCLETAVGVLETEISTTGKLRTITILHDYIEEGEMEAAELVLKSFYAMGEPIPLELIPSAMDVRVPLLLKALMVAERYQADRSKEKIAEALSSTPADQLTLDLAKLVYALPSPLLDLQQMTGIRHSIQDRFYWEMLSSDVISTIQDPRMMNMFLDLTFNSVMSWITRDDLKVHSENDVVYILNMWISKNKPSSDQRDALIKEIRVVNLGPAYLHSILPNLSWFKESTLSIRLSVVIMVRDIKADINAVRFQFPGLPFPWLSAPRKAPGYTPPASTAFTWILGEDKLKQLYAAFFADSLYSEAFYRNGHLCKGHVQGLKGFGAVGHSLCATLQIHQPFAAPGTEYLLQVNHCISIGSVGNVPEKLATGAPILKYSFGQGTAPVGCADLLNRQCPTIQEVVAPYLVDGKLTIKYEVSKVDENS